MKKYENDLEGFLAAPKKNRKKPTIWFDVNQIKLGSELEKEQDVTLKKDDERAESESNEHCTVALAKENFHRCDYCTCIHYQACS